jgi:polynucleotide 5'-hydroxyl-kinase GRC3/NOL9
VPNPPASSSIVPASIDIPAEWAGLASHLAERPAVRRVLVLGAVDVGKSTLCRFLLHSAGAAGRTAALLDADLGQKMIGPPACVTLGRAAEGGGLALSAFVFVGATEPVRVADRALVGIGRLAAEAQADLLLANSDGLLRGPGRRLKAAEIASFRPDLLVALGGHPELGPILADHPALPTWRLPASPLVRRKTRGERRRARRQAFARHFAGARPLALPLAKLVMEGAPLAGAVPPPRLLVGLADVAGRDRALGIVLGCDPAAAVLRAWTTADGSAIGRLRWGMTALDESCHELPLPAA